jgi:hypothetical protein
MMRAWVWFSSIITLRLIQLLATKVEAVLGGEATSYVSYGCDKLLFMFQNNAGAPYSQYPAYLPENVANFTNHGQIAVQANASLQSAPNQATALDTFFGASGWLARVIHALAVELYLKLTPAETERLPYICSVPPAIF